MVVKFSKSGVWDQVPEGSTLIFGDIVARKKNIDVKTFFRFFLFWSLFYIFNVFLFSKRFFYFKKRWQSSERQAD